jgi:hypothetical protein
MSAPGHTRPRTSNTSAKKHDDDKTSSEAGTAQRFAGRPYLQCLETLEGAFPALRSFLEKLAYEKDPGRKAVQCYHQRNFKRVLGR